VISVFVASGAVLASASPVVQLLQNENGWRPQWGLDRVDQRNAGLDDRYHYQRTGRGVYVYVVDSGINSSHEEFTGRIEPGFDVDIDGNGTEDCNGHGTHSAGVIGGTTYGIAKEVRIIPVRVLNCRNSQPSSEKFYAAIDWIIGHHRPGVPAIVNLSVGKHKSNTFNDARRALIADGLIVVGAAGNQNQDACLYSPASEETVIAVGATDKGEIRARYSNHGPCVDLFAPGSDIVAAWFGSPSSYRSSSGTSNAAPIVSGIVALMLETEPALTQREVEQQLVAAATSGAIYNIGAGSPNLLAYSLVAPPGDTPPPNTSTSTTISPTTTVASSTTVPSVSTTVPNTAPTTTLLPISPTPPDDLSCYEPARRTIFYKVPYVCVNVGDRLMWIPKRYSPGRP